MRRTSAVARWSSWSLLLGFCLTLSAGAAFAQEKVPVLVISVGTTKTVSMSKQQDIARVEIENPRVCTAEADPKSKKVIYITGVAPGTSRVVLTDTAKGTEMLDVSVVEDRKELVKQFLKQISETIPQAKVDVNITSRATIVTGTAPNDISLKYVQQAAESTFGKENMVYAVQLPERDRAEPSIIIPRVQQVQLEVQVAVVNRTEIRRMSFSWVDNNRRSFIASILGTTTATPIAFANTIATSITGATAGATGNPNLQLGVIGDRGSFSAFLEALRTEGLAKIMAEPRVTALSGQKASILSGGEVPVVIATSVGSPPQVQYKSFGTSVDFTPVVLDNGTIQLTVAAELSNRNDANSLNVPGVQAPGFDTRRATSVVHIEPGQTLAIGGLIQNTVTGTLKKVPVLGDIPFLGTAFSSNFLQESEEELVILVTPRLAHPLACNQLPKYLPGRETRVADDFELFLTQIAEAPRGPREVCPNGHFRAAHKVGPTAGIFPCGDTSAHGWHLRGNCANGMCSTGTCANGNCGTRLSDIQGAPGLVYTNVAPAQSQEAPPIISTTPGQPTAAPIAPPTDLPARDDGSRTLPTIPPPPPPASLGTLDSNR